jgi:hypothetical protein
MGIDMCPREQPHFTLSEEAGVRQIDHTELPAGAEANL